MVICSLGILGYLMEAIGLNRIMRNLHLENISPIAENQQLTDLIVGTYYRYYNRNGKNLRAKQYRFALRKGRTRVSEGNFDKYKHKFDHCVQRKGNSSFF